MTEQIKDIHAFKKWKFSWRLLGENFVFREWDHFYKMPRFLTRTVMYRKMDSQKKVQQSFQMIQKYFGAISKIPDTQFLKDTNGHYIIKQKTIPWEKLTKSHMEHNPKLLSKFKRLIIANEVMWKREGVFLDLLWSDIVTQPNTIHNLFTNGKDIYVFDFGLLEKTSKNIMFRHFSKFAQWFQLLFVKKFFF